MDNLKPNEFKVNDQIITERPILFSTEMVSAILEDRKNQTRRTVKLDPDQRIADKVDDFSDTYFAFFKSDKFTAGRNSPYGRPGDLLWVRETWADASLGGDKTPDNIAYKADYTASQINEDRNKGIWKPSIHMPKTASRIWLMLEEIRVEKLHDISEEDAIAEGIENVKDSHGYDFDIFRDYRNRMDGWQFPPYSFKSLWISISGEKSWKKNPWVWVIKYKVLSKTGRPDLLTIEKNHKQITGHRSPNHNQIPQKNET